MLRKASEEMPHQRFVCRVLSPEANAFVEDMIHQARKLPMAERHAFVNQQIRRLPASLRDHANLEVSRRAVFKYQ